MAQILAILPLASHHLSRCCGEQQKRRSLSLKVTITLFAALQMITITVINTLAWGSEPDVIFDQDLKILIDPNQRSKCIDTGAVDQYEILLKNFLYRTENYMFCATHIRSSNNCSRESAILRSAHDALQSAISNFPPECR